MPHAQQLNGHMDECPRLSQHTGHHHVGHLQMSDLLLVPIRKWLDQLAVIDSAGEFRLLYNWR
jgi:hypothetical protein